MKLGQRATTVIDTGEFAGAEATVDQILGFPIFDAANRCLAALAGEQAGDLDVLKALYALYLEEARPAWNLEDQRGPVATSAAAMLRLPIDLTVTLVELWTRTFPQPAAAGEPEESSD